MSTGVPSGSTITRVYFAVLPYQGAIYGLDGEHNTATGAIDAAADYFAERVLVFRDAGLPELPLLPVVVERWLIEYPKDANPSGSLDTVMERIKTDIVLLRRSRERRGLA